MNTISKFLTNWSPWNLRKQLKETQNLLQKEIAEHLLSQDLLNKLLLDSIEQTPPPPPPTSTDQNFSHNIM